MSTEIRTALIKGGVRNLKEFGYPAVNSENILTDRIYREFFSRMLEDNRGHSKAIDDEIAQLLKEIEAARNRAGEEGR